MYILNVTPILYGPWQMMKPFLDEVTVEKIKLCKGSIPNDLLAFTNAEQVEEKYGGSAKNATQYWPPIIPSNNYFVSPKDSEALISEEEYISLYRKGSLTNMRIDFSRILQRSQPVEEHSAEISNQGSSLSSPNANLPEIIPLAVYEPKQNADIEDSMMNDTDYIDYMNEKLEQNQRSIETREFQSSFISNIISH